MHLIKSRGEIIAFIWEKKEREQTLFFARKSFAETSSFLSLSVRLTSRRGIKLILKISASSSEWFVAAIKALIMLLIDEEIKLYIYASEDFISAVVLLFREIEF